jgi:hypothetical protein
MDNKEVENIVMELSNINERQKNLNEKINEIVNKTAHKIFGSYDNYYFSIYGDYYFNRIEGLCCYCNWYGPYQSTYLFIFPVSCLWSEEKIEDYKKELERKRYSTVFEIKRKV